MIDTLPLACSFAVGAACAVAATSRALTTKHAKLLSMSKSAADAALNTMDLQLQTTLRDCQKLTAELTLAQKTNVSLSTHLALRESELEHYAAWESDFLQADSSSQLYGLFVAGLERSLGNQIAGCILFSPDETKQVLACDAPVGDIHADSVLPADMMNPAAFERCATTTVRCEEITRLQNLYKDGRHATFLPVKCRDRHIGIACVCWATDDYNSAMRTLRKFLEHWARTMYRVLKYEDEIKDGLYDRLTGLANSKHFEQLLPRVLNHINNNRPLSLVLIEGDNLKEINDKFGHHVGDQMLVELSQLLQKSARLEYLSSNRRPVDHFFRHTGLQFIVMLEDSDAKEACTVAERIRSAVDACHDWGSNVPKWSVSAGAVTTDGSEKDAEGLRKKCEVALMYAREHFGGNQSVHYDHVPQSYKASKMSSRVAGSLDVFDPCTLLQSMAKAGRTGILTVHAPCGRKFWAFYHEHKLFKAHLNEFKGDAAVIEFISTFEEGSFSFQECTSLDVARLEEIHRVDANYNISKSIEKLLMEGIMAQEAMSEAKRIIAEPRMFVRPSVTPQEAMARLKASTEKLSQEEVELIVSIWRQINGRTSWASISDRLETVPTYLRWKVGALLVRSKVIEMTKFGMNYSA